MFLDIVFKNAKGKNTNMHTFARQLCVIFALTVRLNSLECKDCFALSKGVGCSQSRCECEINSLSGFNYIQELQYCYNLLRVEKTTIIFAD